MNDTPRAIVVGVTAMVAVYLLMPRARQQSINSEGIVGPFGSTSAALDDRPQVDLLCRRVLYEEITYARL